MGSELQKCLAGEEFDSSDPELPALIARARKLTDVYNRLPANDDASRQRVLTQLLGGIGEDVYIDAPFYCDYGSHIFVGNNVYVGLACTFIDNNHIIISDNVLIASGVNISTATHPPWGDRASHARRQTEAEVSDIRSCSDDRK